MSYDTACKMLNAADVLEAQEMLSHFTVATYPHVKKQDREKLHKAFHKKAYPIEWSNQKPLTLEEAAKKLQGLTIPKVKR